MSVKVQFNPSTLKTIFNSSTQKVQTMGELPTFCVCTKNNYCPLCFPVNQSPTKLGIILEGVRSCSDGSLLSINGKIICMSQDDDCADYYEFEYAWASAEEEEVEGYYGGYWVHYVPEDLSCSGVAVSTNPCDVSSNQELIFNGASLDTDCVMSFTNIFIESHCSSLYPPLGYGGKATIINVCEISVIGSLLPDATCNYEVFNLYNSQPCYQRITSEDWFIWWDGTDTWIISSELGIAGSAYWERTNINMFGDYSPQGTALGTATVGQGTH